LPLFIYVSQNTIIYLFQFQAYFHLYSERLLMLAMFYAKHEFNQPQQQQQQQQQCK